MEVKNTLVQQHLAVCKKVVIQCSGSNIVRSDCRQIVTEMGCTFRGPRDQMADHEKNCTHVREVCSRCGDQVPRKDQESHDCVASMLKRYNEKSVEVSALTRKVDEIT